MSSFDDPIEAVETAIRELDITELQIQTPIQTPVSPGKLKILSYFPGCHVMHTKSSLHEIISYPKFLVKTHQGLVPGETILNIIFFG